MHESGQLDIQIDLHGYNNLDFILMKRIYHELPPKGTKIGIAFSGGLDTRVAVAWLSENGYEVHAYTGDLAQPDEENPQAIPEIARKYGARGARLLDCKESLTGEGLIAIQTGAFHIVTGGKKYFNTTPLGRAVTTTSIIKAMKEDDVHVFGDGSTHKGNDIQRFYRYGIFINPDLRIYKPWLDPAFVEQFGGRKEMSEYLESLGKPYKTTTEKAYSTDANMLGATHEAKDLEFLDKSMHIVNPIMGVAHWNQTVKIEPETVEITFERGYPVSVNGEMRNTHYELMLLANQIGGRHGLGMSDQIENRVIEAKSRGIYEAPGMALFHIAYERLLSSIHNESTMDLYYTLGRKLGRLLYEGKWYDPEAMMLKESITRWIAPAVSGTVTLQLRRGDDYTIMNTNAVESSYDPEKLSMERTEEQYFTSLDRIGALEMLNLPIMDSRKQIINLIHNQGKLPSGEHPGLPELEE